MTVKVCNVSLPNGHPQKYSEREYTSKELADIARADEENLARKNDPARYRERRAEEFPPIGDQLDSMWKAIDAIAQKKPVPQEALDMIAAISDIKARNPKPV